jgi:transketolase
VAWKSAIEETNSPHALIFTRQNLPHQQRNEETVAAIDRGGYILREGQGLPDAIIIATGSEDGLAMSAADQLGGEGVDVRVVSMPNPGRFMAQDEIWRESVLPSSVRARVAVEAGVSACWHSFVGDQGKIIGVDRFGASAPAPQLFEHYGLTVDNVIAAVRAVIKPD